MLFALAAKNCFHQKKIMETRVMNAASVGRLEKQFMTRKGKPHSAPEKLPRPCSCSYPANIYMYINDY